MAKKMVRMVFSVDGSTDLDLAKRTFEVELEWPGDAPWNSCGTARIVSSSPGHDFSKTATSIQSPPPLEGQLLATIAEQKQQLERAERNLEVVTKERETARAKVNAAAKSAGIGDMFTKYVGINNAFEAEKWLQQQKMALNSSDREIGNLKQQLAMVRKELDASRVEAHNARGNAAFFSAINDEKTAELAKRLTAELEATKQDRDKAIAASANSDAECRKLSVAVNGFILELHHNMVTTSLPMHPRGLIERFVWHIDRAGVDMSLGMNLFPAQFIRSLVKDAIPPKDKLNPELLTVEQIRYQPESDGFAAQAAEANVCRRKELDEIAKALGIESGASVGKIVEQAKQVTSFAASMATTPGDRLTLNEVGITLGLPSGATAEAIVLRSQVLAATVAAFATQGKTIFQIHSPFAIATTVPAGRQVTLEFPEESIGWRVRISGEVMA